MTATSTVSTSARKAGPKASDAVKKAAAPKDAIALLRADHKLVNELFDQFENARSDSKKAQLVARICTELKVHAQIEEEIFYPAVKAALKDKELVPEATVEHASVKDLIAQVEGIPAGGEMYEARVKVMGEFVKHHVKEEQNEMFPKARKAKLDLVELGHRMLERKSELIATRH